MVDGLSKAAFSRYLVDGFVDALNAAYGDSSGGWWRNLADDRDVFVAIRGGYLNAYYKGNSLIRLDLKGGKLSGAVHYKYLLKPSFELEYVSVVDGRPKVQEHGDFFLSDLSDISSLKKAATPYAGIEKAGVHDIIKNNPNVVDVEIAFGSIGADDGKATAPRVDFAALQEDADAVRLTFFEAKHFSNPELRSSGEKPPVLVQVERYSKLLAAHADDVRVAYLRAFSHVQDMRGVGIRHPVRDRLMQLALSEEKPLVIDTLPRLVVFGFDDDQKRGTAWAPHRKKLRDAIGDRLLCRGSTAGFSSGISAGKSVTTATG